MALLVLPWGSQVVGAVETLDPRDRQRLQEAFKQVEVDNYGRAQALVRQTPHAVMAKAIRWIDLTRRGTEAGFEELSGFLSSNPDWPRSRSLRRNAEAAMPVGLPSKRVIDWFERYPPISAPGAIHYGSALLSAGRRAEAISFLRRAWVEMNFTATEQKTFRKRFMPYLERADFIARLDRLLWDGRTRDARNQARRLGKGYARLAEARILLAARKPGVDGAIKRVPASLRADPGLIYERARWRLRKDRFREAFDLLLEKQSGESENPGRWWQLRRWTAREAIQFGHYRSAYSMATRHHATSGTAFAEGEWLAGWIALTFLKRPEDAYRHFSRMYEGVSSPISLARGAYWAGEAAKALRRTDWSQRWYEVAAAHGTTFYGQLAAQELKQPVRITKAQPPTPSAAARSTFMAREIVEVVRILGAIGETRRIDSFIWALLSDAENPTDYVLIAELADHAGRPDLAVAAAKRARREGHLLPSLLFPLPELPGLEDDPETALVLALIRQESSFDERAISPAGARGLMQLMPATAKREARDLNIGYRKGWLTTKPAYNLRLGQTHLRRLLEDYRGSAILALAAYNAGASRVSKWIAENGDPRRRSVDPVRWIELIPFSETRNYVQRVLEGRTVYRVRLGVTETPLPLEPATAELYNPKQ